ncbi:unnamed protein product [Ceratitis capitata]|uniref:(Mediterranean fruit fly) hypothetical protein n=1 Tax=Ceratitis capitata TaxID=7213 RepID=A0A811V1D4_CERCA|nr:unnamed protein product [Ceratitis capitata]
MSGRIVHALSLTQTHIWSDVCFVPLLIVSRLRIVLLQCNPPEWLSTKWVLAFQTKGDQRYFVKAAQAWCIMSIRRKVMCFVENLLGKA